jgi:hypothetical protein
MAGEDKDGVLEALEEVRSKSSRGPRREPQDCGDVGLKIGRDGTWYYQNGPIERKPLVRLFASVLRLEGDDRYYLVTPAEKVEVSVEDAPFLAVAMLRSGTGKDQRLSFRTNVDETVEAGPDHPLSFRVEANGGFTPYILVRDRLKARLTRPVYYELVAAGIAEGQEAQKQPGVWSAGMFFPFPVPEGGQTC